MNDQSVELLRSIAERLGMEAARVWPQVVMVTWIQSVFWLVVCPVLFVIATVLFIVVLRLTWNCWRDSQEAYAAAVEKNPGRYISSLDYDCMGVFLLGGLALAVCAVVMIATLCAMPSALSGALYPEAQTVLRLAGK